jgi:hypothetical protein
MYDNNQQKGVMTTMVKIKWTNKYSNETGYVAALSNKEHCFINTFDVDEAKAYSEKAVKGIMTRLESFHETDNNIFEIIPA